MQAVVAGAVLLPALLLGTTRAQAAVQGSMPPLPDLAERDALLLRQDDPGYEIYQPAHNKRTALRPTLRAMCKTASSVAAMVEWARTNSLPFAVRSGGHSYEGFSQSDSVVIDTRLMNRVVVDSVAHSVTVGAGATLGTVYEQVGRRGYALAAGTCPTVGISGHTLGGGYGLLARRFGLTCDNLLSLVLVDAEGRQTTADEDHNPDLFWACRGGGGGSFGIATEYRFRIFSLPRVITFKVSWILPVAEAVALYAAWQAWAPAAPANITAVLNIAKASGSTLTIHCSGQSTGSDREVRRELQGLLRAAAPQSSPRIKAGSFLEAVSYFSGGSGYPSVYMKAKSDFVLSPMSEAGIGSLMHGLLDSPMGAVIILCDAYGGAIDAVAANDSAFARRAGTLYSIQYYASWTDPRQTAERAAAVRTVYDAMRPYASGGAYVNYCDLDLVDWPTAYWGQNLARLKRIKQSVDPANVFRHAQSVPLS